MLVCIDDKLINIKKIVNVIIRYYSATGYELEIYGKESTPLTRIRYPNWKAASVARDNLMKISQLLYMSGSGGLDSATLETINILAKTL